MKEVVTKVIDTLTQEDFHGALPKLLERYKCIASRGNYFEDDLSFTCVLSIKMPIWKKSANLFNDPRIYIYIYMCVCVCVCERERERWKKWVWVLINLLIFVHIFWIIKNTNSTIYIYIYIYISLRKNKNRSH